MVGTVCGNFSRPYTTHTQSSHTHTQSRSHTESRSHTHTVVDHWTAQTAEVEQAKLQMARMVADEAAERAAKQPAIEMGRSRELGVQLA